jgi:hypothetical protein
VWWQRLHSSIHGVPLVHVAHCTLNHGRPLNATSSFVQVQQQNDQQTDSITTLAAGASQQEAQLQDFQALLEAMQGERAEDNARTL